MSPYILQHAIVPEIKIEMKLNRVSKLESKAILINERNKHFLKCVIKSIEKGSKGIKPKYTIGDKVLMFKDVLGDVFASR